MEKLTITRKASPLEGCKISKTRVVSCSSSSGAPEAPNSLSRRLGYLALALIAIPWTALVGSSTSYGAMSITITSYTSALEKHFNSELASALMQQTQNEYPLNPAPSKAAFYVIPEPVQDGIIIRFCFDLDGMPWSTDTYVDGVSLKAPASPLNLLSVLENKVLYSVAKAFQQLQESQAEQQSEDVKFSGAEFSVWKSGKKFDLSKGDWVAEVVVQDVVERYRKEYPGVWESSEALAISARIAAYPLCYNLIERLDLIDIT